MFGSISEQRELTVRFDDERPSSGRLLFEPCPKNQGRSRAIDCDHFVEWSGDQFLSEFLIEHRGGRQYPSVLLLNSLPLSRGQDYSD